MSGTKILTRVVACALLSLACLPVAADIGRLFFSAEQREEFEQARRPVEAPIVIAVEEPELIELPPEVVTVEIKPEITANGFVRRTDGAVTLWINGEDNYAGDLASSDVDPHSVRERGGKIRMRPSDGGAPIILKPGQTYDPNEALLFDAFEARPASGEIAAP